MVRRFFCVLEPGLILFRVYPNGGSRVRRARKGLRFLLPLLLLLPALYFFLAGLSEPSNPTEIEALAPVEIVAGGFREPTGVVVDQQGVIFLSDQKDGGSLRSPKAKFTLC